MCGRVILTLSAKMIAAILNDTYDVEQLTIDDFIPRYNIGPGQELLSVIQHNHKNRAGYMNWQYIPSYAKDEKDGFKLINARSETIHEKVSFKSSFQTRRCLVLCNGFYEWHRVEGQKTPYFFHKDEQLFALGAIWNPYTKKDGSKHYGISLITADANNLMAPIHHRMPVIIKPNDINIWLNKETDLTTLQTLMMPVEDDYLKVYQVSSYVNSIKNNDIKCIEKVS